MSITRSRHMFTRSRKPGLRSPYVNRTLAAPVHTIAAAMIKVTHVNRTLTARVQAVAEATIEVTPCRSHARRSSSNGRESHD